MMIQAKRLKDNLRAIKANPKSRRISVKTEINYKNGDIGKAWSIIEPLTIKQETKLRQNIISDRSIIAITKNNTLDFINKVKYFRSFFVETCCSLFKSQSDENRFKKNLFSLHRLLCSGLSRT